MSLLNEISNGESKIIEFKEIMPKSEVIAKTVVAFSNTSGGKLIIGVNDQIEVIGVDEKKDVFELQDNISSIIYDLCYPNIIPEIYTQNIEGKVLLVIEIFRGNLLPYYLKNEGKNNGVYIRIGATNRKASYENIVDLERQKRNISFDEEINRDIKFDELNIKPIKEEFDKIGKQINLEKFLNLKLVKKENNSIYPTNALLIILGEFENCIVKCSRFKGTTMDIFLDKKEYTGDIFLQLENTLSFIKNHINVRSEIKGLQRSDIFEIPIEALREAIINAVVHRDYVNMGRDIKVGVYDDIVNIVSPGSFPSTITEENILDGRSEIRNRIIARVFKELNYIEQWGTGIKRIKSTCLKVGLKEPLIKETGDFVDIELYRKVPENAGKMPENAGKNLSINNQERMIIEFIKKNNKINSKDTEKLINVKDRRARKILSDMVEKNIVKAVGNSRARYYVLEENNK